jgi:hypothetical protein
LGKKKDKESDLQKRKNLRDKGIFDNTLPEYRTYKPEKSTRATTARALSPKDSAKSTRSLKVTGGSCTSGASSAGSNRSGDKAREKSPQDKDDTVNFDEARESNLESQKGDGGPAFG